MTKSSVKSVCLQIKTLKEISKIFSKPIVNAPVTLKSKRKIQLQECKFRFNVEVNIVFHKGNNAVREADILQIKIG